MPKELHPVDISEIVYSLSVWQWAFKC